MLIYVFSLFIVAKSILDRALRQVDSIISDLCVCDLGKEKSEMMAQVMEECFRNFLEKRRCEMRRGKEIVKFADIDMLEELIKKCHFTEDDLDASRPAIENAYQRFVDAYMAAAKDSKGTEILYQYFRDRELKRIEEIMKNHAAITIQAAWRGYIVRRTMQQHVCVCTCMMVITCYYCPKFFDFSFNRFRTTTTRYFVRYGTELRASYNDSSVAC